MDGRACITVSSAASQLVEAGRHAEAVAYLGACRTEDLQRFPALALLRGRAHGRLGQMPLGKRWVRTALNQARAQGDGETEARALNVFGALLLEEGHIDEACEYFRTAIAAAKSLGDYGTIGRSSNNLGIAANLRGENGRAVGAFTMALAAFQRADVRKGTAETLNNLANTYRDMGDLDKALVTANAAVEAADAVGDLRLVALAIGGRAEIRLLAGDVDVAHREIERALEQERAIGDVVGEAEDSRVLACVLAAKGQTSEAENLLRDVMARAEVFSRPLLAAKAERSLARILHERGRVKAARSLAMSARKKFAQLGCEADVEMLDAFIAARCVHRSIERRGAARPQPLPQLTFTRPASSLAAARPTALS